MTQLAQFCLRETGIQSSKILGRVDLERQGNRLWREGRAALEGADHGCYRFMSEGSQGVRNQAVDCPIEKCSPRHFRQVVSHRRDLFCPSAFAQSSEGT